jgi:hypothetical protein
MMHFHGVAEFPFGFRFNHPAFVSLPALHTFAKSEREKRIVRMFAAFMQFSQGFVLPPGTPDDQVKLLKDAFRKAWKDPDFLANWRKMTGADASPVMPEALEELVRGIT